MKPMLTSRPGFTPVDPLKIRINLGCLLDIPTGRYVRGAKGENILNGGLGALTGIAGKGNMFKSVFEHFMTLKAAAMVAESGIEPYINTYDTETNIEPDRMLEFTHRHDVFKEHDIIDSGIWNITDSTKHTGDEWFTLLKDFLRNVKLKNKKDLTVETPMLDRNGDRIKMLLPTFGEVDSLTEFETNDVIDMQNKNAIGDGGANTLHIRLGLAKTRLLMETASLANAASHYTIMTAQAGFETGIQQGPVQVNTKRLQHMPQGEKIKGTSDKFFFLPNSVWLARSVSLLTNQGTKGPEYPKTREDIEEGSTDLNLVTFSQLRNKSGLTGFRLPIIVSQREGVLPTLTEFHYIKEEDRFGLEGNNTTYNLVLYPDVKISRTTVRSVIDSDPLFCRAVKITADLLQMKQLVRGLPFNIPDPKELYTKLAEKYDWKRLLATRDYWTFNQYEHPVPYLSTMDLIEMYHDQIGYVPYWWNMEKYGGKSELHARPTEKKAA